MANVPLFPRNHGSFVGGHMLDTNGKNFLRRNRQPLAGKITMQRDTLEEQLSLDFPPVEYAILDVALDGTTPYSVRVPVESCLKRQTFTEALQSKLPKGVEFDNEDNALWNAIIALSFEPDLYPTYEKDYYYDAQGSWYRGHKMANFRAEIVGETRNNYNELIYRVRNGNVYFNVSADTLRGGGWAHLAGPEANLDDYLQMGMAMVREWRNRSEDEKSQFKIDELQEQQATIEREMDRRRKGV